MYIKLSDEMMSHLQQHGTAKANKNAVHLMWAEVIVATLKQQIEKIPDDIKGDDLYMAEGDKVVIKAPGSTLPIVAGEVPVIEPNTYDCWIVRPPVSNGEPTDTERGSVFMQAYTNEIAIQLRSAESCKPTIDMLIEVEQPAPQVHLFDEDGEQLIVSGTYGDGSVTFSVYPEYPGITQTHIHGGYQLHSVHVQIED